MKIDKEFMESKLKLMRGVLTRYPPKITPQLIDEWVLFFSPYTKDQFEKAFMVVCETCMLFPEKEKVEGFITGKVMPLETGATIEQIKRIEGQL